MEKQLKTTKNNLDLSLDVSSLNHAQIRLLRSINSLLLHAFTTENEGEYFESSSELIKLCALSIQQANFNQQLSKKMQIPYATQALEFSLDNLTENMESNKLLFFDN